MKLSGRTEVSKDEPQVLEGSTEFMFPEGRCMMGETTLFLGRLWSRLQYTTNQCRWLWSPGSGLRTVKPWFRFEQDSLLGWVQAN